MSNTNLPHGGLNSLYNMDVQSAEWMTRPKQNMPFGVTVPVDNVFPLHNPTTHSGVRVTLTNGQKFLIHKGPEFGHASQTVVTGARHMSDKWQVMETKSFGGTQTVGDFVKSGGEKYNMFQSNCHCAAHDMMNQGK